MDLQKLLIKKHRHVAIDLNEIVAVDFNESLNDLKIHLRGGGSIGIEGKKAARIWNRLSKDLPELLEDDAEKFQIEDLQ